MYDAGLFLIFSACVCADGWTSSAGQTVNYPDNNPVKPCDIDINECMPNPCGAQSTCSESSTDVSVAVNKFKCLCNSGFIFSSGPEVTSKIYTAGDSTNDCTGTFFAVFALTIKRQE